MVRLLSLLILLLLPNPFTSHDASRDVRKSPPAPVAAPHSVAQPAMPSLAAPAPRLPAPRAGAGEAAVVEPAPASPDSMPAANDPSGDRAPEPPFV